MNEVSPLFGLSVRQPPSNAQAEQALLGALLTNNKVLDRCGDLRPEHFADPLHGKIFAAIVGTVAAGRLADAVTLHGQFAGDPDMEAAGGPGYLARLLAACVSLVGASEYAREVILCWRRRQLVDIGETLVNAGFAGDADPAEEASRGSAALDALLANGNSARKGAALIEAVDAAIAAAERAAKHDGPVGISTGFPRLDDALGGLEDGALYVCAGRPGMGKTALGVQIGLAAAKAGIGVGLISLEMQAAQIGRRVLALESGIPQHVLRHGRWSTADSERIVKARQRLAHLPLTIEDEGGLNAQMIALRARGIHRKHGLGLLIVDHLHIVATPPEATRMGATWAVGQVSNALKRLAKEMQIPVLALAQLNRGVEGRDDKRPSLADLRQSGEIEQDAEAVMLLYRPEYYLPRSEPERKEGETAEKWQKRVDDWHESKRRLAGKAEVILAKVRDGEPGTVNLHFDGSRTCFAEAAPQ